MTVTLYIDVDTGRVSRTIDGAPIGVLRLYLRDIVPLSLCFTRAGAQITSTVLSGNAIMKVGLRAQPGSETLMALADTYELAGQLANLTLSLNTTELVDYFATLGADSESAAFTLEVEVSAADGSTRQTITQNRVTVTREVNRAGDQPPAAAEESAENAATSAAAAAASAASAAASEASAANSAAAASLSESNAATSSNEAVSAANDSSDSAAAALANRQASDANATATAADRIQTGLDSAAAATSANAAATSETNASSAAVSAILSKQAAEAAANGASGYRDSAATSAASAAASAASASAIAAGNLYPLIFTLAVRDSLLSDGATASRRAEWTPGSAGAVAGRAVSIPFDFSVPTSNPGAEAFVFIFGPVLSGTNITAYTAPYMLLLSLSTAGALVLRQGGAASTTADYRQLAYAGFRAAFTGLRIRGCVVFATPDSATAPVIYLNGVDVTASFAATSGGTVPNWLTTSLDTTRFHVGYNWPIGRLHPQPPILGALTPAEVLDWTQSGRFPTWCDAASGHAGAYVSDFSAAADGWANQTGTTVTGNVDAIGGVNDTLQVVATNANAQFKRTAQTFQVGCKYLVTFRIYRPAANTLATDLQWMNDSGATMSSAALSSGSNSIGTTADTWVNYSVILSPVQTTQWYLRLRSGGTATVGDTFYLTGIRVVNLGPIFRPVIQAIPVIADAGTNRLAGVLTGHTPVTDRRDWVIQADTNLATNQQLLGASVFADATRHVLDDWCMETAGTPTVTAGSASGSSAYKASGALAATKNLIALVTRVLATVNLWASSTTTDTIKHTIRGHRVD